MEKWKLELASSEIQCAYEKYLERMDAISTIYSVVLYADGNLRTKSDFIDEEDEIRLSERFLDGMTTIKTKKDIEKASRSGVLHQTNCAQAIIAIISGFEGLIDECISIFKVPRSAIQGANVVTSYGKVDNSSVLKKFVAIHEFLNIESVAIGERELTNYYKYTLIRNRLVHQQGKIKTGDVDKLDQWVPGGKLVFDYENVDSIIHYFLLPIEGFVKAVSEKHRSFRST